MPGLGSIKVDVAYGGMIYCLVDAESLGFKLNNSEAAKLVEVGERIKRAAAVQIPCVHPENPHIHTINQTLFAGFGEKTDIWNSHGDKLTKLPRGFQAIATTSNSPYAAI